MAAHSAKEAAHTLWAHWQAGTRLPALPFHCRPHTREEGYAIQAQLAAACGQDTLGWKIAATSVAGQRHIGVDGPLAGRLFARRVYEDGAIVPFGVNHMQVAEPEFAFRFGRDLAPRLGAYEPHEVLEAVTSLHPAIEIPDSRYEDFAQVGAAQLIADNACAHYFVLGSAAPDVWRDLDLSHHRVIGRVDGHPDCAGSGANVLGDPRVALAWLVNELSSLGITLGRGQVVTTGTCMTPLAMAPGARISADFGILGRVGVQLGA